MLRIPLSRVFPRFFKINWYNDNAKYVQSFPLICVDLRELKGTPGGTEGENSQSSGGHSSLTFSPNPQTVGVLPLDDVVMPVDPGSRLGDSPQGSTRSRPVHESPPEAPSTFRRDVNRSCPNSTLPVVPELAHLTVKEGEASQSKISYSSKRDGAQFGSAGWLPNSSKRPPPIIMPPQLSSSPQSVSHRHSPSSFVSSPRSPSQSRRVASSPFPASPLSLHNTRVGNPSSLFGLEQTQTRTDRLRRFVYRPPTSPPPTTLPPVSPPPAQKDSPTIPEAVALPPLRASTPVQMPE